MTSRRTFIYMGTMGAAALVLDNHTFGAVRSATSPSIRGLVRRDTTIGWVGEGGSGDCLNMTWTSDDRQLVAACDGLGWSKTSRRTFNSRLWYLQGTPKDATVSEVTGYPGLFYPDLTKEMENFPRYYGLNVLAVNGRIYQFLSFFGSKPVDHWAGVKLIFSPDNGRTWCNQDGSTPVIWEPPATRSHENMTFVDEPSSAFSMLSFLQMGQDYEQNEDGYVYVYAANVRTALTGGDTGADNKLSLFRVRKDRILDRKSYEFFVALRADGEPVWSNRIEDHGPLMTFPEACCGSDGPSVVYLPGQRSYLMANSGTGVGETGKWFSKPSYLGFWTSRTPWGPWIQVHEEEAWTPGGDTNARCYSPKIAPKWIANDGKSFFLVWGDFQHPTGSEDELHRIQERLDKKGSVNDIDRSRVNSRFRRWLPHYRFNFQRVDMVQS